MTVLLRDTRTASLAAACPPLGGTRCRAPDRVAARRLADHRAGLGQLRELAAVASRSASTRSLGRITLASSAVVRPSGNSSSASSTSPGAGRRSSPTSRFARAVS